MTQSSKHKLAKHKLARHKLADPAIAAARFVVRRAKGERQLVQQASQPAPKCPLLLIPVIVWLVGATSLWSQDAIEEGRDSLGGSVEYPWYDSETDGLRRVDVPEEPEIEPPPARSSGGSFLSGVVQVLFWIIVTLVLAGLLALVLWALMRRDDKRARESEASDVAESSTEVDRIENLPFKVRRPQSDLLAEARRLYQEGNYGEAIIYLFSYKLVQLDKFHFIRLTRGKTNRQYLGEVRPQPRIRELLERTMVAFEDVFFGNHDLDRNGFESCWRGLDEFHQHVNRGTIG